MPKNKNVKSHILLSIFSLSLFITSCCFSTKEKYLGSNLYLSEYSNIERSILFQQKRCSNTGIEIVPMTVFACAYNSDWIIAKSGNARLKKDFQYWIINNNNVNNPSLSNIKANTLGPLDWESFTTEIKEKKINLTLEGFN